MHSIQHWKKFKSLILIDDIQNFLAIQLRETFIF